MFKRSVRTLVLAAGMSIAILVGQLASAAQTFTSYERANQATKIVRDASGQGTADATATSTTAGAFSVSSSTSSNTEAGVVIDPKAIYVNPAVPALYPCDPLYYAGVACPPPVAVGYNYAVGSASITQNAAVSSAGSYTVAANFTNVTVSNARTYAGPPLFTSYASAVSQALMYLTFYPCSSPAYCYPTAYRYKYINLSNGSNTLTDTIPASGVGRIEAVVIVRAETISQGRATANASATATLASLSVNP